jgi:hypothetical protein
MKNIIVGVLVLGMAGTAFADKSPEYHGPVIVDNGDGRAAGCSPANERLFVEFNNVKVLIETGGSMWQDRTTSVAAYEYPKGSKNHLMYSGALWMGGEDINGQLKLAAHTFRTGNDFWPGPLGGLIAGSGNYNPFVVQTADLNLVRDNGAADITPSQCNKYDKFYTIRKAEVQQFITWWNCENGVSSIEDCAEVEPLDPEIEEKITNWPAHGDPALGEDEFLAPFYDNTPPNSSGPNGFYDPINDGDYPWYDIRDEIDCRNDRRITLFGDETNWWVFNDKGNIHTETGGDPIGMEIRAQAFTFATDDAINDMTFYNYELINRGTQTLYNTYFGQWADPDVGNSTNDFVGCDVSRGLGYAYNGESTDDGQGGQPGYGANVPAIGIDFFEGPYQDSDGEDNAKGILPNQALNGIGYGDGVADNERFGMRRFVYYNIGAGNNGDPSAATHYYNYLQGLWQNSAPMLYGGNGYNSGTTSLEAAFMFPGDSDPLNWSTDGIPPGPEWTELTAGNADGDRRFIQSAGPFILTPGAVNNITVGVVIGVSDETDLDASVIAMKTADSKAQALFDNCFELVEPPVAPTLTIQEMENQLILYVTDPPGYNIETYFEKDKINIITPDELIDQGIYYDDTFRFEGYQIYQMRDELASVSQLEDLDYARLVAQCDIENGVSKLVNYTYDEQLNISIPAVMVDGADEGLKHSFLITEDLFATGDRKLVNHKKYYYIAVAYAYNQFKLYDPNDPILLDGQKNPYLRSRISGSGKGIESVVGIPHDPTPEADGTIFTTTYGYQPEITQIEGLGNGGTFLELTDETVDAILANGSSNTPVYKSGSGPINVQVIDPLSLLAGEYTVGFGQEFDDDEIDEELWWISRSFQGTVDTIWSDYAVGVSNEQLILDWGLSVSITEQFYVKGVGGPVTWYTDPIDATISFEDSSKMWLWGVPDGDGFYPTNWVRSGTTLETPADNPECTPISWIQNPCYYNDKELDPESQYEKLLNGSIAPFNRVGHECYGMPIGRPGHTYADPEVEGWWTSNTIEYAQTRSSFAQLHDVDIVITADQSKWTRCPVIEMNDQPSQCEYTSDDVMHMRSDPSVGKDGQPDASGTTGFGWFPGYAIDVNTGKRLNMAFGENSWLAGDNGRDMIWNPTSSFSDQVGNPLFGGMHYVYVFGVDVDNGDCPAYDEGAWLASQWDVSVSAVARSLNFRNSWKNCMWVMEPLLLQDQELLATDVKISVRINKPYENRLVGGQNNARPMYKFSITDPTITMNGDQLLSVLDNINIVPNPYYAYSSYETSKLDNRVKITNLPERCTITIFNMQGALVRTFVKDDPMTSLDWDLQNHTGIPISGGLYIIHIEIPIVDASGNVTYEEKILKWYGVLRQPDLDNL